MIFSLGNKQELETCYVNRNNFDLLVKELLLVKQYRIEVWRKNSKSNEWSMNYQVFSSQLSSNFEKKNHESFVIERVRLVI
jgi:hypothetical protein